MVSENDAVARTSTITGLSSIREVTQSYVLLNTSRWTPTAIFSEIGRVVWCTTRVEVARVVAWLWENCVFRRSSVGLPRISEFGARNDERMGC